MSQFLYAACTGPGWTENSNHAGDTKGQAAWQVHKTTRQTDGTSCNSFPRETHITCENRAHDTVPEKDVSSPTFNSGVSRANGMKHALKVFEETIFQLLFSMPDDSVVHSISLGDGCKQGVTQKKKMFSVIHAGGTQSGVSANMTLIQNLSLLGNQIQHSSSKTDFSHRFPATHPRLPTRRADSRSRL